MKRLKETKSLLRGELIGLDVKIPKSKLKGRVIDETKNTFTIETEDKKRRKIIKNSNEFEFIFKNKKIMVDGKKMSLRPEDRIKMKVKFNEESWN